MRILREQEWSQYSNWLSTLGQEYFYYSIEWLKLLRNVYGLSMKIVVDEEKGDIKFALPFAVTGSRIRGRRLTALPFSHRTPFLYDHNRYTDIIRYLSLLCSRLKLSGICIKDEYSGGVLPKGWRHIRSFFVSKVRLDQNVGTLFQNFSSSNKRAIRKAVNSGRVEIRGSCSLETLKTFRGMMIDTRRRQNVPIYPKRFFEEMYGLIQNGLATLEIGKVDGQDVCGLIRYPMGKDMVYGYGASFNNREALRLRPNNLLFWHAIQRAKKGGYRNFDFGTSTLTGNEGLIRFKEGFGAQTRPLYYLYYSQSEKTGHPTVQEASWSKLAGKILARLPFPIYQKLSEMIFREFAF